MKLLVAILACAVALTAAYKDYADHVVLSVTATTPEHVKYLLTLRERHQFLNDRIGMGRSSEMILHRRELPRLQRLLSGLGMTSEVAVEDLKVVVDASMQSLRQGSHKLDWENYGSYDEINAFLDEVVANTEGAELFLVGNTYEGRDINGVHFNPGGSTKKVWIDGGIHAREWISPAVTTYVLNEITTNYANNQEMVDAYDWYIVPLQNADGYEYSRTNDRFWRKNRNPEYSGSCVGVDLNRNWDFHWMEIGASQNPCSEVYAGPEGDSEPETKVVRDFVLDLNSDDSVIIFLTLHSYSQVWLSPWGWTSEYPEDYDDLLAVMGPACDALTEVHGTRYDYGTSTEVLGAASGASDDWGKGVGLVKHSYTIELRDTGEYGFVLPPEQILPTSEETWAGIQVAIRTAEQIPG